MGRPLNKKYFGNRNIGSSSTTADNKIGGEGLAGFTFQDAGSFAGNSNVAPITVPAAPLPTLPGGVRATFTLYYNVQAVTTGAGKTDLAVGDTFGDASLPGLIAKVTDLSGANAVFSVTTTGASAGDDLTLAQIPQDTIGYTLTKIAGSGTAATFLVDVLFHVHTVVINEKGSGYTGSETITFTKPGTTSGNVPAATLVLTTDSGAAGTSGNQENAIIIRANIGDGVQVGDIIKQVSTRRYKVKTAYGTDIVELEEGDTTPNLGKAMIIATDSSGATYYVYKLTSRKAVVYQKAVVTSYEFDDGQAVKWTLGSPTLNSTVQLENA